MEEPRPSKQVFITIDGVKHRLVPTENLLGPELREVKRVCGMALVPWERGLRDMDWDAWFAWIYVSVRRVIPTLTTEGLEELIGDTPPIALLGSLEDDTPESAQEDPLTLPSEGGSQKNDNDSGEKIQPPSTSEASGLLISGTQT